MDGQPPETPPDGGEISAVHLVRALLESKFPNGAVTVEDFDPEDPLSGHAVTVLPTKHGGAINELKVEYTCEEGTVGLELQYEASTEDPLLDEDFVAIAGMQKRLSPEEFKLYMEGEDGSLLVYFSIHEVSMEELGKKLDAIKFALAEQGIVQ